MATDNRADATPDTSTNGTDNVGIANSIPNDVTKGCAGSTYNKSEPGLPTSIRL
ncbi:MAG: hypothetical protein ACYSSO_00135 [Planctomycetota bacterium]